ncbi:MAG TPA: thioredoxin domain-containing protein [Longimicrobiaceae bacterium]
MASRPSNRLAGETSPYLLQHQHNPVDWYPWGEEAFARARAENRPILLSIGYSACHWCHVMERESFEDDETAAIMNEHFVNVKVDREERPDVDSLYMTAVQRLTGHGGWPMTVFITPDGEPFYGGTYFPPAPRHGMPAFQQVLLGINEAWTRRREDVRRSADELTETLRQAAALRPPPAEIDRRLLDQAFAELAPLHDRRLGGFGAAPKFPQPLAIEFLLRYWSRTGNDEALAIVRHTLRLMARGGIYDHVGGGFHRYSVDARWLVPHFEKMLYDNALLARVYLHVFQATGEAEFRQIAEDVLAYVLREMTSAEGAFHSAQDADSEGEEGKFYVWTPAEIDEVLGSEDGARVRAAFGVSAGGNFEGSNILNLLPPLEEDADDDPDAIAAVGREVMAGVRDRLYTARARRVRPGLDDKVLTAWNAMMLRSFAEAGRALNRPEYVDTARRNADFIRRELWREGGLLRTYRDGRAKIPAFLDDHALTIDALVALYEATFDPEWIAFAQQLADAMIERFWDEETGLFFDTPLGQGELVVRPREVNDSATPSGTSAAATALQRLGALTGVQRYEELASRVLVALAELAPRFPQAFGELLAAVDLQVDGVQEVAIVGEAGAADTQALLDALRERYLPRAVVAWRAPGAEGEAAAGVVPLLADRDIVGGSAAAYVCRRFTCRRPVTEPSALLAELEVGQPGRNR